MPSEFSILFRMRGRKNIQPWLSLKRYNLKKKCPCQGGYRPSPEETLSPALSKAPRFMPSRSLQGVPLPAVRSAWRWGRAPAASVGKRPRVEEMAPKGARVACEAQLWGLEPISQCSRSPSEASLLHIQ